jgi:hypothetical protein
MGPYYSIVQRCTQFLLLQPGVSLVPEIIQQSWSGTVEGVIAHASSRKEVLGQVCYLRTGSGRAQNRFSVWDFDFFHIPIFYRLHGGEHLSRSLGRSPVTGQVLAHLCLHNSIWTIVLAVAVMLHVRVSMPLLIASPERGHISGTMFFGCEVNLLRRLLFRFHIHQLRRHEYATT